MDYFNNKVFLGVVEDNVDPDRQNKCRVRVINVFDGLPTEDLPWASPFKDHNGIACSLPEVGKVVSIEFENGDIYLPVYRYSEHYNVNLQEKLKALSDDDYTTMKALLFDHKTQIYVNESEGLKLDHKFNMMNVTEDSIDIALKDNFGSVNIGTADATQQAILGNNFLDWFDMFVDHLMGAQGGPYFGNLLAPVVPHPGLITHLLQYKALKDPKFLSHNVNFNDNGYVDKLDRVNKSDEGDDWKSTTESNDLSKKDQDTGYEPMGGTKETTPDGDLTTSEELDGAVAGDDIQLPDDGDTNQDVLILIQIIKNKGYKLFTSPFQMNIVGIRYQYEGDNYSNKFVDKLYAFYKDDDGKWQIKNYKISTLPGTEIKINESKYKKFKQSVSKSVIGTKISLKKYAQYVGRPGLGILQPAQYVNSYKLDYFPKSGQYKSKALISVGKQVAYRDSDWDSSKIKFSFEDEGNFGMHIHRGFPGGVNVNNWSEGCQVFASNNSLKSFISLMERHEQRNGNKFSYTLVTSEDYEEAQIQVQDLGDEQKQELSKTGEESNNDPSNPDPQDPQGDKPQEDVVVETYGEFTLKKSKSEYYVEPDTLDFGSLLVSGYDDDEAKNIFRQDVDDYKAENDPEPEEETFHPNATYEREGTGFYVIKSGPRTQVQAKNKDNVVVFNGNPSFSVDEATLIQEAELNVFGDSKYSG